VILKNITVAMKKTYSSLKKQQETYRKVGWPESSPEKHMVEGELSGEFQVGFGLKVVRKCVSGGGGGIGG
jgi:hypothetical protein